MGARVGKSKARATTLGDVPRLTAAVAAWATSRKDVHAFSARIARLPGRADDVLAVELIVYWRGDKTCLAKSCIDMAMESRGRGWLGWLAATLKEAVDLAKRRAELEWERLDQERWT